LQLAPPFLASTQIRALTTTRASWYQVDITGAGWPLMSSDSYYWVAVTPCSPLSPTTQGNKRYNGAVWAGIDDLITPPIGQAASDPSLFKGRQLISQRFAGDAAFTANQPAAVPVGRDAINWGATSPASRYTNWEGEGSTIRYGIQILGWQVNPPASLSGGWGKVCHCAMWPDHARSPAAHTPPFSLADAAPFRI
jgi:hypothetical protein